MEKKTKKTIISEIAKENNFAKRDVTTVINSFLDSIIEIMSNGEEITVTGFGKFIGADREESTFRNPSNGELIVKPATIVPKFKFSQNVKKMVAGEM